MRVSKKSWHYKLMKWVLRDSTPTPKDMQNGCPYYWLLVFSILASPFLALYKGVKFIVLLVPKILLWALEQMVNDWIDGLDDVEAYNYNHQRMTYNYERLNNSNRGEKPKLPKSIEIFFNKFNNNVDVLEFFMEKKFGSLSYEEKVAKKEELQARWKTWSEEEREEASKRSNLRLIEEQKQYKIERIRKQKRREAKARWEKRMKPMNDAFDSFGNWWKKNMVVERGRRNDIIKKTKQFVGAFVSIFILAVTFIIVQLLSYATIALVDFSIEFYWIYLIILAAAAIVGIIYLLYVFIFSWGQNMVNQYNMGKKVWYIEPLIYFIWYPIKYIGMGIGYIGVYVFWKPTSYVFEVVLIPVFKSIGKFFVSIGKGIAGSTGIFGEYFGASYSDYCPGLEWVDFDEEENED